MGRMSDQRGGNACAVVFIKDMGRKGRGTGAGNPADSSGAYV